VDEGFADDAAAGDARSVVELVEQLLRVPQVHLGHALDGVVEFPVAPAWRHIDQGSEGVGDSYPSDRDDFRGSEGATAVDAQAGLSDPAGGQIVISSSGWGVPTFQNSSPALWLSTAPGAQASRAPICWPLRSSWGRPTA
jgi:hypothetical protein